MVLYSLGTRLSISSEKCLVTSLSNTYIVFKILTISICPLKKNVTKLTRM